ncbi:MAG TPA: DUF4139 domain-containing protein, partial [Chloroflexia bacterium]|nr:DUF4139 domain-containing protein [Chloroflexia bacterium]
RIKVERDLTERSTAKAALVGNLKRTLFAYKITLTNHLAGPAHVTVYDQLPVPRHEEIKVKLQEATPRPADQSGLNIIQWVLDLPPQEKRELLLAFTVEHPRTLSVTGLG